VDCPETKTITTQPAIMCSKPWTCREQPFEDYRHHFFKCEGEGHWALICRDVVIAESHDQGRSQIFFDLEPTPPPGYTAVNDI